MRDVVSFLAVRVVDVGLLSCRHGVLQLFRDLKV